MSRGLSTSVTREMGYLGYYPTPVWYLAGGHMNILSLWDVTQHYWVTMDTTMKNASFFMGTTDSNRISPPWARVYTNGSSRWIPLKIICAGYLSQQYMDNETTTLGVPTNVLKQRDAFLTSLCVQPAAT